MRRHGRSGVNIRGSEPHQVSLSNAKRKSLNDLIAELNLAENDYSHARLRRLWGKKGGRRRQKRKKKTKAEKMRGRMKKVRLPRKKRKASLLPSLSYSQFMGSLLKRCVYSPMYHKHQEVSVIIRTGNADKDGGKLRHILIH